MLRGAVVALVLLAVLAWGGDGKTNDSVEAYSVQLHTLKREMAELEAQAAKLNDLIQAEKQALAKAEAAHQEAIKRLEAKKAEIGTAMGALNDRYAKIQHQLSIKQRDGKEKPRPSEVRPRATNVEDKLDLILKKLDDLDRRVKKLEGKTQGTQYDGLRPPPK